MSARKRLWPLVVAVAISAALHAMIITGGAIVLLPPPVVEPPPLVARLAPPPPAEPPKVEPPKAKTPKPKAAPKKAKHVARKRPPAPPRVIARPPPPDVEAHADLALPEPTQPDVQPAPVAVPQAGEAPPQVVATAPSTTLAIEPPPARELPRRGRISYTLFYSEQKFVVGRTVQTWECEDGRYRIGSISETTGLAAVFRDERRTYLSEGTVTAAGLRPNAFLMSRQRGSEIDVARARFDWNNAQITWGSSDEKKEGALPAGSQDFLSLMYQFSLAPPHGNRIRIPITTGTKFETYELDVLPEETIDTPLGPMRALPLRQVRKPGAETIEIWLATEYRYLPVKVRFFGRDGNPSGEQVVNDIRLAKDDAPPGAAN